MWALGYFDTAYGHTAVAGAGLGCFDFNLNGSAGGVDLELAYIGAVQVAGSGMACQPGGEVACHSIVGGGIDAVGVRSTSST